MHLIRADLARLYAERDQLFRDRWFYGSARYAAEALRLRAAIHGYELMLCGCFSGELGSIFVPSEAVEA